MSNDQCDSSNEQNGNGTPSTASRIKPVVVENAFPTPPRRDQSHTSETQRSGRQSPVPSRLLSFGKASPAPKEHRSIEALRSNVSRGHSSGLSSATNLEKSYASREVSRKNSQFFDQAFATRESYYSAKERVSRDSTIVVEVQLNSCMEKEQAFLNDMLMSISEIYHRPTNNVMVIVTTDNHIIIGGSQESAYLVTVTGLQSEIASMKNLRTTMIVQEFFADSLKIPANRGVIKFNAVREDAIGTNGTTMQEEINKLEAEEKRGMSLPSRQSNRTKRGSTLPSTSETYGPPGHNHSRSDTPILPNSNAIEDLDDQEKESLQRASSSAGRRIISTKKSFLSFWKKSRDSE